MDWSIGTVFRRIGINPAEIVDVELSAVFKKPVFDVYKFDDFLREKIGDYERGGKNMRDIIRELYPDNADKIIEALLL